MRIQIDNQVIDINNGKTVITVLQRVPFPSFKHKFDFDFNNYPNEAEGLRKKDMASYYWLSNLWCEFVKVRNGGQLKLF